VTLGRHGHDDVETPMADDVTVVIGSAIGDAFDVAFGIVLAHCVEQPPDELWIVPLTFAPTARSSLMWQLPHATDQHDHDAVEPRRLLERLRWVLAEPNGPSRVVLVTEMSAISMTPSDRSLLADLVDAVHDVSGLALIVITDHDDSAGVSGDTTIRVGHDGRAAGAAARRNATLVGADGSTGSAFTPVERSQAEPGELLVVPFVVGRPFTALERRVEQRRARAVSTPDVAAIAVVQSLREAAALHEHDSAIERIAVPPPMPAAVDLDELFAASPGDGVPLGVADDPSAAAVRTRWWEPGSGSLFVFGSRRSGMDHVLTTMVMGLVDRFSDLEVRILIIEPSSTRRRAFGAFDRDMRVIAPDNTDDVTAALDDIAAELERHRSEPGRVGPRLVLLIGDLGLLRQQHDRSDLGRRLDEVLTAAAAPGAPVDVIASASDLSAAGPVATTAEYRLVGASSNHADLVALGVEHPIELDGLTGRCRAFPGGDLVQIAVADVDLETLVSRRTSGGQP
jgi:hypothetical protein